LVVTFAVAVVDMQYSNVDWVLFQKHLHQSHPTLNVISLIQRGHRI
jgi:hypothetical protein